MSLTIKKVDRFQTCNFCNNKAIYDAPLMGHGGTWAYFCEDCYVPRATKGVGTKFELKNEDELALDALGEDAYDASWEAAFMKVITREGRLEAIMEESLFGDSCGVECADGCVTEPDGKCPHGYSSPLLLAGLI